MEEDYIWTSPRVILLQSTLIPTHYSTPALVNFAVKVMLLVILFGSLFYLAGGAVAASASIATLIYFIAMQLMLHPPVKAEKCEVEMVDQRESGREVVTEGFLGSKVPAKGFVYDGGVPTTATEIARVPTKNNPFMNTLPTDILDAPGAKASEKAYEKSPMYDDFFRIVWHSDPNDVFGKTQSQRQFYTMPSTSVPNDRESYQQWLYGGATSCKQDRKTCKGGAEGGYLPWRQI